MTDDFQKWVNGPGSVKVACLTDGINSVSEVLDALYAAWLASRECLYRGRKVTSDEEAAALDKEGMELRW